MQQMVCDQSCPASLMSIKGNGEKYWFVKRIALIRTQHRDPCPSPRGNTRGTTTSSSSADPTWNEDYHRNKDEHRRFLRWARRSSSCGGECLAVKNWIKLMQSYNSILSTYSALFEAHFHARTRGIFNLKVVTVVSIVTRVKIDLQIDE